MKKIFDGYSETRKIEFLAGRFVAKEAFSKALGTGLGEQCKLHDMEVLKGEAGKPVLYFKDELVNGFVSITHSKHYAVRTSNLIRIVLNLSKRVARKFKYIALSSNDITDKYGSYIVVVDLKEERVKAWATV